jgi:hypothetical protein
MECVLDTFITQNGKHWCYAIWPCTRPGHHWCCLNVKANAGEALCCLANKPLYIAFVDLERAFDRVLRKVLWWALEVWVWRSGLLRSFKPCIPMLEAECLLMVSTARNSVWELEYIKDPSSVYSFSSLCWKHCHVSFGVEYLGNCSTLMAELWWQTHCHKTRGMKERHGIEETKS